MKTTVILILTLFTFLSLAEETPKPLPADAVALKKSYEQAQQKALDPLRAKYIAALQKLLEAHTKAGNLDGALAIREEIKSVQTLSSTATTIADEKTPKKLTLKELCKNAKLSENSDMRLVFLNGEVYLDKDTEHERTGFITFIDKNVIEVKLSSMKKEPNGGGMTMKMTFNNDLSEVVITGSSWFENKTKGKIIQLLPVSPP